jgi:hypothetical protein
LIAETFRQIAEVHYMLAAADRLDSDLRGRAVTQLMEVLDTLDEALERQEARGSQASGPSGQT